MRFAFACAALAAVMSAPAAADVVTFADGDLSGGGRIAYSPEPFQTTAIVDVGGEHGNVFQATRGDGLNGSILIGTGGGSPFDEVIYPASFDIRLIDGADLLIFTSFFGPQHFSGTDWTTVTLTSPFLVTITLPQASAGQLAGNIYQLDNIVFAQGIVADPSVPEPASWAMMISGFGLVGGAMRRRKPASAALA